jgi:hypothetical protein
MMENDSTTGATDNSADLEKDNQANPANVTTDSGNANDKKDSDNSESSKSTDGGSGDDDKQSKTGDTTDDSTSAPKFDTDLDEWAGKTGRPVPTTDRERELYQEIRNGQRNFSRENQKDAAQSIETAIEKAKPGDNKQDDEDDDEDAQLAKDVADLKRQNREERNLRMRSEYFADKAVSTEESTAMGLILQEKVDKATSPAEKQRVLDYWTNPEQLEDWHNLAKARLTTEGTDKALIEEEAARKERERIAKESHAAGGSRNASTGGSSKPKGYNRTEYLKSDDD